MAKAFALAAGAATVVLLGGSYAATTLLADGRDCAPGSVMGGDIGGPFELVTSAGETVTQDDVITGPTLIYFGYTYCPDVCPFDVARNAAAVEFLEEDGELVTPVFISVDARRDTLDVVGDYAANFHPRMIGLTGSPEQIKAAADAYRVRFTGENGAGEDYLMGHTSFSYLMTPDYGFVDFFSSEVGPEDMAHDISCLLDQAERSA